MPKTFNSPAWVHGAMPEVWDVAIGHLKASGPVSLAGLRWYLLEQVPGVDQDNADRITQEFLDSALERKVVLFDELNGDINFIYPTK